MTKTATKMVTMATIATLGWRTMASTARPAK